MHNIMRFPSEKTNKREIEIWEGTRASCKAQHRPTWYGERRWKQEASMLLSRPSTENPGHTVASGHTASVMQAAAAALARSSKRAAVPQRDSF
jgi:hypothetical protein